MRKLYSYISIIAISIYGSMFNEWFLLALVPLFSMMYIIESIKVTKRANPAVPNDLIQHYYSDNNLVRVVMVGTLIVYIAVVPYIFYVWATMEKGI